VSTGHFRRMHEQSPRILVTASQDDASAESSEESVSTGHFRRMHEQSPRILVTASQDDASAEFTQGA
jgi:hypothetical protein